VSAFTVINPVAFSQVSRFVGVGPRLGTEGEVPTGRWSLDYMAGAAVLYGQRTLTVSSNTIGALPTTMLNDWRVVFNTDAAVGIGFAFTSNTKFTLGYRVDAYFDALRSPSGVNIGHVDYIDHGPFARITAKY
jgi:hypothetical protein